MSLDFICTEDFIPLRKGCNWANERRISIAFPNKQQGVRYMYTFLSGHRNKSLLIRAKSWLLHCALWRINLLAKIKMADVLSSLFKRGATRCEALLWNCHHDHTVSVLYWNWFLYRLMVHKPYMLLLMSNSLGNQPFAKTDWISDTKWSCRHYANNWTGDSSKITFN